MASVIDAAAFLRDYKSPDDLKARRIELGEDDERTIADLLLDQVEFADVLIINKTDLVSQEELEHLQALLRKLNTDADIIMADHGKVPLDRVLNTGRFDMDAAQRSPGWIKELMGEHTPKPKNTVSAFLSGVLAARCRANASWKFLQGH